MKTIMTLCATLLCAAAHAASVAVVDMNDLVRLHPNTPKDKADLELMLKDFQKERDDFRSNLEAMNAELEKAAQDLEKQGPALSEAARANLRSNAMTLQKNLIATERAAQDKMAERQRQMQETENRFLRRTSEEIRAKIETYAKANKIDIVIDMQALPYFNTSVEITNDILKSMNVDPKLRKAAEKPAAK